jgi:hypothetical protein
MWKNYPSKANNSNSINSNNRVIILYDFKFKYNLKIFETRAQPWKSKSNRSLSKTKTLVNDERHFTSILKLMAKKNEYRSIN